MEIGPHIFQKKITHLPPSGGIEHQAARVVLASYDFTKANCIRPPPSQVRLLLPNFYRADSALRSQAAGGVGACASVAPPASQAPYKPKQGCSREGRGVLESLRGLVAGRRWRGPKSRQSRSPARELGSSGRPRSWELPRGSNANGREPRAFRPPGAKGAVGPRMIAHTPLRGQAT